MTIADRVAELLRDVSIEEQLRGREVEEAARILGDSIPTTYRRVASAELGHIKLEGSTRKGKDGKARGRAGSVRIRLIDIVTFQVMNERVSSAPIQKQSRDSKAARVRGGQEESTDERHESVSTKS